MARCRVENRPILLDEVERFGPFDRHRAVNVNRDKSGSSEILSLAPAALKLRTECQTLVDMFREFLERQLCRFPARAER